MPNSIKLTQLRQRWHNDTVVFVSGNFNILHPGHMRLIEFAAAAGQHLVVGVHPDGHPGVLIDQETRLTGVRSISAINHAFLIDDTLESILLSLRPQIVIKGREHEGRDNEEAAIVESYGGKLVFSSGDIQLATSSLIANDQTPANQASLQLPTEYLNRYALTHHRLLDAINQIAGLRVATIGDLIIDRYTDCEPLGMSQEDPTLVVSPVTDRYFLGGAGIVAAHCQSLGAQSSLFTLLGDDVARQQAQRHLDEYKVQLNAVIDPERPTPLKQRLRAHGKTLLRLNKLRSASMPAALQRQFLESILDQLNHFDALIFADFSYGCLPDELVQKIIDAGKQRGLFMAADSQSSSQIGDIARFHDMSLITPTEREARLAIHNHDDGLVVIAEQLRQQTHTLHAILTLGDAGALIQACNTGDYYDPSVPYITDRLPAFNTTPIDVAGAGDSLLATATLAMASGSDIWTAAYLGSIAAGCQVSRTGNRPLQADELRMVLETHAH